LTTYFSQGSVATDLRKGGSSNSSLLCTSFLTLTVKKLRKIGLLATTVCHLALGGPVINSHRVMCDDTVGTDRHSDTSSLPCYFDFWLLSIYCATLA